MAGALHAASPAGRSAADPRPIVIEGNRVTKVFVDERIVWHWPGPDPVDEGLLDAALSQTTVRIRPTRKACVSDEGIDGIANRAIVDRLPHPSARCFRNGTYTTQTGRTGDALRWPLFTRLADFGRCQCGRSGPSVADKA